MKLSQSVAGGSRNVETARFFSSAPTNSAIPEGSSPASASPSSWKFALNLRLWTKAGPKGNARNLLAALLWNSDEYGRSWLGMSALMERAGIGSERTVRKALDLLAKAGWIRVTPQTWSSLTAEQIALGRQAPRRGDVGQASHLYQVIGEPSSEMTPKASNRPGLTRTAGNHAVEGTPLQNNRGPQEQICRGGPGANVHPDPYYSGSVSKEVSEKREAQTDTHNFSKAQESKNDWAWLNAWNVVLEAHAEKTKAFYGVPAMRPDVKRDDRRAVAECLDGTATELAAKLRARGIERELVQVRQDLASRVMGLYFKRDNEHLRRVKHALRDLPREFHARIIEAMQAILRESHDAANASRRPIVLEEKAQVTTAESASQMKKAHAAEKPLPVTTAQEARRIIEALNVPPSGPVLAKRNNDESTAEQAKEPARSLTNEPQLAQRSLGRAGAPRWGALPPTPTRIRFVSRLQLPEPEEAPEDVELQLKE